MKKLTTKKIALIGVLTALYVVLSFFMKFTVIGNIQIDLGYVAYAIALSILGPWGIIVGCVGCGLESMIFSPYGFSISWFLANFVIGFGGSLIYPAYFDTDWIPAEWHYKTGIIEKIALATCTFIIVFFGVGVVKTGVECILYDIPLAVKIPKNLVATVIDTVAMCIGLYIYPFIKRTSVLKEE